MEAKTAAGADTTVEFSLPAQAGNVPLIRHALAGLAEALEMGPSEIADLKTVVTEACMNVVVHAYEGEPGPLEVEAWREGRQLVVTVRDYGGGIRPLADVEHRSLRLGLPLIAALTESVEVGGAPGRGTEVRMKLPIEPVDEQTAEPVAPATEMRINLPVGDVLAPVLSRVISMFATRADFSVDELSDAVLLSDAISAGDTDGFVDRTVRIVVAEQEHAFELRVGPLENGGGRALVDGLRIPSLDASLESLADEVRVEDGDQGEIVLIRIGKPV